MNRNVAALERRLLCFPKKDAELTTLVLAIYVDRLLLAMVVIALVVVLEKLRTTVGDM